MAKIRFPKSNSLKWVRLQDYDLAQSDDTRLYYDFAYTNIDNDCFTPKHIKTTPIWQQFRTNSDNIQAYIVTEAGVSTDITTSVTGGIDNANGTKQYELYLNLSTYSTGKYYFLIQFTDTNDSVITQNDFQSEWFEIVTDTTDLLKVEWFNTSFETYNDGIIWSQPQQIYIQSRISDSVVGVEKTVFQTENYKLKTTQAQPIKSKIWQLELLPDYLMETLNIAMQKSNFLINDIRYNSDGTFEESERVGDTRFYPLQITLRILEDQHSIPYEDYTDDPDLTGDVIQLDPFALYAGEGVAIFADTGKAVGYY